jgi:hypothetical protein
VYGVLWLNEQRRVIDDARLPSAPARKDNRGVDLISDALPFGRLWYDGPNATSNAIGYAEHRSRSHDADSRLLDRN